MCPEHCENCNYSIVDNSKNDGKEDKVYICSCVDGDYEVGKELSCMTCGDLDYYWYEDNEFIN